MKKVVLSFCMLCVSILFAAQISAQTSTFTKGDQVAGIGIGIGGSLYSGFSYGSNINRIPAISVFYENCIKDNLWDEKSSLGIGGVLGFAHAKYNSGRDNWGWKCTNFIIGFRGSLHYAFVDKLDTYTSLMLGFNAVTWKWTGDYYDGYGRGSAAGSSMHMLWNVGARYYFTDAFAAFAELGYGFAILNLGVALKF
jgi:hypothetical protein